MCELIVSPPKKNWHFSRQNQSCKGILRDATPLTLTMEVEVSTVEVQTAGENDGILTSDWGSEQAAFRNPKLVREARP